VIEAILDVGPPSSRCARPSASTTRRRVLEEVEGRRVAVSHLGVGRIHADGEGFRWVASK
jgi:hypothetical protein